MGLEGYNVSGTGTTFVRGGMGTLGSTEEAKSISNELSSKSKKLHEISESLTEVLSILEQNWSTNQADQKYYVEKLKQNKEMLKKVASVSSKVSDVVGNFATKLEAASSKTVS